ncbi:MAG: DNA protecting protein DprA [Desulfobacca sp. 4484_104]|nr:MAG: DNA protecting protein DprA [Desulfobacca sp. 4484_104]RLA90160.1 MAG: DNA-protecting protein DprA [Deltaproteobacteria bacterium]
MTDPFNRLAWIALRAVPGIGVINFQRLMQRFGQPEAVFQASYAELASVPKLSPKIAQAILNFRAWPEIDRQLERLAALGCQVVTQTDENFPPALRQIPYPPPFLYVKGTLEPQDQVAVAVVGTRKLSHYGKRVSYRLGRELSLKGVTVVSGLARGIDTAAHQGSMENGGRTLAVLGCGLDIVYPPENKELYRRIPEQGVLISEFPPGTPPEARNFPIRNRLISGLALGVVVVEAGLRSGALITARMALDQGREVFGVPGPIDAPGSLGPHRLIQEGAKLVQNVDDILSEISGMVPHLENTTNSTVTSPIAHRVEDPLVALLSCEPRQIEELIMASGMPAPEVLSKLTMLELQGLVRELPGKCYVLAE